MSARSPSPWVIDRTRDTFPKAAISDANGFIVATVANSCDRMLIAVAPELLESLREAVSQLACMEHLSDCVGSILRRAREIMDKAEGRV